MPPEARRLAPPPQGEGATQERDPRRRCGEAGAPSPLRFGAAEPGSSIGRRPRRLIGAPTAPPPPRCAIRPRARAARNSPARREQTGERPSSLHVPRRDEGARRMGPRRRRLNLRRRGPIRRAPSPAGEPAVRDGAARERGRRRSAYEAPHGSAAPGPVPSGAESKRRRCPRSRARQSRVTLLGSGTLARAYERALGSRAVRARDLETLEFTRVLDAIAALARSAAGRQAVLELRPTSERAEAERRLDLVAELVALAAEAGRPPTADVPLLAPALAAAAPDGATLEPRRLAEVRDLLAAARQLRAYLRRDPARFPRLAAEGEAIDPVPEVAQPLAAALDETGLVRDDASPTLAAARAVTRELRGEMEARLLGMVRDPDMGSVIGEQYVTVRNGRFVVPIRTAAAGGFAGVVQDRSASGETVFMEPLRSEER